MTSATPPSAIRFSSRVSDYIRYRPSYPTATIDFLVAHTGLKPGSTVADIGSGTGISARLFLERGFAVIGVEPNAEMRAAADAYVADLSNFKSIHATATATGLPSHSVDLVLCAQAFHWFASGDAVAEFRRIVRPGGNIALMWNARLTSGSSFLERYDALLHRYGTDYAEVNHENISLEKLEGLFGHQLQTAEFANEQRFDWEGLRGRALSSSYVPGYGQPDHEQFVTELEKLFHETAQGGRVIFTYATRVFVADVPSQLLKLEEEV